MKNRSRPDIIAIILQIAEGGSRKTKIMYEAFLSFPQLKEYLELLTDNGLLELEEEEKTFYTTEKGRKFVSMYLTIDGMIPKDNKLTRLTI